MSVGGLLYTTETELDKKWDFYKAIYRKYVTNDFLDDMNFEMVTYLSRNICILNNIIIFKCISSWRWFYWLCKTDKLKLMVLINKLEKNKYTERLQNISEFNSEDFEGVIKRHDAEDTYIYLDPPYARFNEIKNDDDGRRLFWYGCDRRDFWCVLIEGY
jgi:site-specific DNA-adenine methylase